MHVKSMLGDDTSPPKGTEKILTYFSFYSPVSASPKPVDELALLCAPSQVIDDVSEKGSSHRVFNISMSLPHHNTTDLWVRIKLFANVSTFLANLLGRNH